jgi:hypothetical protein
MQPGRRQVDFLRALARDGGRHTGWRFGTCSVHSAVVGSLLSRKWVEYREVTPGRAPVLHLTEAGRAVAA